MEDDSASRQKSNWTAEQDQALTALRADQFPWKEISRRLGRTVESCCARYRALTPQAARVRFRTSSRWPPGSETKLKQLLAERKSIPQIAAELQMPRASVYSKVHYIASRKVHTELTSRVAVPTACLVDRDRRMAAERDLTAEFFGDPPPGFSALDRREQRA